MLVNLYKDSALTHLVTSCVAADQIRLRDIIGQINITPISMYHYGFYIIPLFENCNRMLVYCSKATTAQYSIVIIIVCTVLLLGVVSRSPWFHCSCVIVHNVGTCLASCHVF
jgi:hypothetical protein